MKLLHLNRHKYLHLEKAVMEVAAAAAAPAVYVTYAYSAGELPLNTYI
jgi:hypothetical protein